VIVLTTLWSRITRGKAIKPGLRRHQMGPHGTQHPELHMIPGLPVSRSFCESIHKADFRSQSLQQNPRRMRMQHVARLARTCAHDGRRSHGILINAKRRAARNHILAKKKRSGPLGAFWIAPTSIP
jgi:hypothetical protein